MAKAEMRKSGIDVIGDMVAWCSTPAAPTFNCADTHRSIAVTFDKKNGIQQFLAASLQ
jgi:hypothetical protein